MNIPCLFFVHVNGTIHTGIRIVLTLATEVNMVDLHCMMAPWSPRVSTIGWIPGEYALHMTFTLRAWTLIERMTSNVIEYWIGGLERKSDHVVLRIPLGSMASPQWRNTRVALATLSAIVSAFRMVDLSQLAGEEEGQLFWIDRMVLFAGRADISVIASPACASFVRTASLDVFARITAAMRRAECVIQDMEHVPRTRGASRNNGALHLVVGDDCACLGVAVADLPRSERYGWEARGHNIRFISRIITVLVALATLEDECRAMQVN